MSIRCCVNGAGLCIALTALALLFGCTPLNDHYCARLDPQCSGSTSILAMSVVAASGFTIGGNVSIYNSTSAGPLVLVDSVSGQTLNVTSQGTYSFALGASSGTSYSVSVQSQPTSPGQICAVSSGTGTITGSNVMDINITCTQGIFLTATTTTGNMGGIAGADAICNADANRPSTTAAYAAFLVDSSTRVACTTANCSGGPSEHTNWILNPNTTYYRADGVTPVLTTDANGIFAFGTLTNPFTGTATSYYTGFINGANWRSSIYYRCTSGSDWTDDTSLKNGASGVGDASNYKSLRNAPTPPTCDKVQNLLCVQQ